MEENEFTLGWDAPLWADTPDEYRVEVRRPKLAHYTSVEVLEKILVHDEIWLSNPRCMNDLDEVRFGISEAEAAVEKSALPSEIKESAERNFHDFWTYYLLDTYLLCLSEHDDDDGILSMWRGYGRNGAGAALVIDTAKIAFVEGSPLIVHKVHYATRDEQRAWIREKIAHFSHLLSTLGKPVHFETAASALFYRLKEYALFTKNRAFEEEREWRIVYDKQRDRSLDLAHMFSYFIGPHGIEPKLKFKISGLPNVADKDLSLSKIIHRIILGPGSRSEVAVAATKRMLEIINKSELRPLVCGSNIPYRG